MSNSVTAPLAASSLQTMLTGDSDGSGTAAVPGFGADGGLLDGLLILFAGAGSLWCWLTVYATSLV